MGFEFRPAKRSEAKPLIGLYSESGCGKTYSALLLARGFVGPTGRIGMIETESGRGEVYADQLPGGYSVLPLRDDFSPATYGKAIAEAEKQQFDALIIDSASHEWEGQGGVLSMAAANQGAGKKGVLVWQQPKMEHQRHFMLRLMQTPIPLVIVCMRAKYPMQEVQKHGSNQKEWVRSTVLEPKQSEDILFEMMIHGWIDKEHRLHVTKYTRADLARVMVDGEPIGEETGRALAAWSAGGVARARSEYLLQGATGGPKLFQSADQWRDQALHWLNGMTTSQGAMFRDLNDEHIDAVGGEHASAVRAALTRLLSTTSKDHSHAA